MEVLTRNWTCAQLLVMLWFLIYVRTYADAETVSPGNRKVGKEELAVFHPCALHFVDKKNNLL